MSMATTFPGRWTASGRRTANPHFAPSTTCSENTAGSEPFEAKELRAVRDLLLDSNYRWIGLLDLHSFGEHVSYPFSYSCDLTPRDSENLYEASLRAARKASKVYGRNFGARSACTHHAKGAVHSTC
ncbi:hypothetical protein BT69DRAFT_1039336 [Atractiella rhizophila]|nr:hypothetical protein BT69DRAFT_1039336 [Atractiella rhizophila]